MMPLQCGRVFQETTSLSLSKDDTLGLGGWDKGKIDNVTLYDFSYGVP